MADSPANNGGYARRQGTGARLRRRPVFTVGVLPLALVLLSLASPCPARAPLSVVVSILPQTEIVREIGGDGVEVEVLIPPGLSPTTYEASPRQLVSVAGADLLVPVGVLFETTVMSRIHELAPTLSICNDAVPSDRIEWTSSGHDDLHVHETSHPGHHHNTGPDPHFWLDPIRVIVHAEEVAKCLCAAAPERCPDFRVGLEEYRRRLEKVDRTVAERLAPFAGRTILVFHPAYGYFAERYGLLQVAIENEGKEPSARHLSHVIGEAKVMGAPVIFVQPQFAGGGPQAVAEAIGAEVVTLDPLAPDLAANIERLSLVIAAALAR